MTSLSTACAVGVAAAAILTGCSTAAPAADAGVTATTVVLVDSTLSAASTDLFAAAQNRTVKTVGGMAVGDTVIVRGLNSNVGQSCADLVFTLPAQPNPAMERQAREGNQNAVASGFADVIACSQQHGLGGTEMFGGISEAVRAYPDASRFFVYTDGCENATIGNICDADRLQDPTGIVAQIPDSITPQLSPTATISYIGIGRGSDLPAGAVESLRQVIASWTERTGASYEFQTS